MVGLKLYRRIFNLNCNAMIVDVTADGEVDDVIIVRKLFRKMYRAGTR